MLVNVYCKIQALGETQFPHKLHVGRQEGTKVQGLGTHLLPADPQLPPCLGDRGQSPTDPFHGSFMAFSLLCGAPLWCGSGCRTQM